MKEIAFPIRKGDTIPVHEEGNPQSFTVYVTAAYPPAPLLNQPFWQFDWQHGNKVGKAEVAVAGAKKAKIISSQIVEDIPF
jgi:hypothetical protein